MATKAVEQITYGDWVQIRGWLPGGELREPMKVEKVFRDDSRPVGRYRGRVDLELEVRDEHGQKLFTKSLFYKLGTQVEVAQ